VLGRGKLSIIKIIEKLRRIIDKIVAYISKTRVYRVLREETFETLTSPLRRATLERVLLLLPAISIFVIVVLFIVNVLAAETHIVPMVWAYLFGLKIPIPYSILEPRFVALVVLLLTVAFVPVAVYSYAGYRLSTKIEEQLPVVVRIVADTLRTGETIERAIELIARSGLSPINTVLARALILSRYGHMTVVDSIREVGKRLRLPGLLRFADLLDVAFRYGARSEDMLDIASRTMEALQSYRRERVIHLRPYIALIYTIVFVYVFMCAVIVAILVSLPVSHIAVNIPLLAHTVSISQIKSLIMNSLLALMEYILTVQLLASSFIIGRVVYENPLCGLIHFIVLAPTSLALTYGLANVLVPIMKVTVAGPGLAHV